ncbi:PPK2 family polyphosphate kinase [Amycolatopsis sp. 195334CR]|uniref:PPK2 family polyphosphate kinase n=1 Tax=Amycolatopsis sp. 195334CR TaxID=2814588 RepID=UPI001A8D900F|nr:PPK2 family polyphosphate kinase [Amycolatopsis sp. 195334CR]MBN6038800.1 polyphosphate kinase 2 family protein [Amycolatopsis sp. 195334CR]
MTVRDVFRATSRDLPDPGDRPAGPSKKSKSLEELPALGAELDDLQERLFAEGERSVLLVLQGMDTSGKGGTVRHVLGMVNPQGVRYQAFKKPTAAERRHHFLWRVRKVAPAAGQIGVFDRSHYEDVLVPRVLGQLAGAELKQRYREINAFERELADAGTTVLKVFLHISPEEQLRRLRARLLDPAKRWKYTPDDLAARERWHDYQRAYRGVLRQTSTAAAPWYVVPADRKWYRNWAVAGLLLETLREMAPGYPDPGYDVAAQLAELDAAKALP